MSKRTYFLLVAGLPVITAGLFPIIADIVNFSWEERLKIAYFYQIQYVVMIVICLLGALLAGTAAVNVSRFGEDSMCRKAVLFWTWALTALFVVQAVMYNLMMYTWVVHWFLPDAAAGKLFNLLIGINDEGYALAWLMNAAFYWAMAIKLRQMERQGNAGEKGGG